MIAFNRPPRPTSNAWQAAFLSLLPTIRKYAESAFRYLHATEREEAIQEAIANACVAYARLVQQDRSDRAFATVLVRYAIAQVRDGRKVGTSMNTRDVMSKRAQRRHGFTVDRLDSSDPAWFEAVVADTRTPVVDQASFRIDFPEWLKKLSRRDRRVALKLAEGHSTSDVAERFGLSAGRVSQLRSQFHTSWRSFHHETAVENDL
jgi:RNA polymerase sigma factor (sigma-70 family)